MDKSRLWRREGLKFDSRRPASLPRRNIRPTEPSDIRPTRRPAMMKVILVLAIVCFTGLHAATFYSCGWVVDARVNCTTFEDEATCGTDGVTYKNKCTFSQAHCFDRDLHFAHAGACDSLATTPKPGAGGDVVLDFFCTSLSHTDCGPEVSHVCASNGRTYSNLCEYEKAKCTHRELHVVSFGDC